MISLRLIPLRKKEVIIYIRLNIRGSRNTTQIWRYPLFGNCGL